MITQNIGVAGSNVPQDLSFTQMGHHKEFPGTLSHENGWGEYDKNPE